MKSIRKIPSFVTTSYQADTNSFHVFFPPERESEFHDWCEKYNIGTEFVRDEYLIKSDCHVVFAGTEDECPYRFIPED